MRRGAGLPAVAAVAAALTLAACGSGHGAAAGGGNCASGSAASGAVLTVPKEPDSGVNTIGGKCWAQIAPTPITTVVIGSAAPAGTSSWEKAAWSGSTLYVLAWVAQWPLPASGASLWNSQTVEFYVSGNNDKAGPFGPQDGQFGILLGDQSIHNGTDKLSGEPTGLQQVVQGKGYYAELIVPWSLLGVNAPAKAQQYKFDVAVDFGGASGKQTAQTMWIGTQNNYKSTSAWGSIQLG